MDPNFSYNGGNFQQNGYYYGPNDNFSQQPYQQPPQFHHYPQQQPQSYYPTSSVPPPTQNYPHYQYNQSQQQGYQPQYQPPPHYHYHQSVPYQSQPAPQSALPPSTIEVVVPQRMVQSSPAQSYQPLEPSPKQHPQQRPPYSQAIPQPQRTLQNLPPVSESPRSNQPSRPPPVVVSDTSKTMSRPQQAKNAGGRTSSSQPLTPQRTQQVVNRAFQSVEVGTKPKQQASKADDRRAPSADADDAEPDYATLLCVLADDYLEEARREAAPTEEYYNFMSKAIGSLETALANFKLPPLREAQVSLRYARLLYEETENHDEAESRLTKAIELCDRHKFTDLKYEMQLLLAQVLYESKPKAAIRDIQRMIEDIEAYRHTVWLYLFRFQLAMFSLASSAPGDVHGAVVQLEKIGVLAKQSSDGAMLAFAATIEALLHLSSSNNESVTATQSAIAKARTMQLNPDAQSIPQIGVLSEMIDLASSQHAINITETDTKRKRMQEDLIEAIEGDKVNWRDDGIIFIPVSEKTVAGIQIQGNKHIVTRRGKHYVAFSWLRKDEAEVLGYLFSADSSAHKNGDNGKAEKFAEEGLSRIRKWTQPSLAAGDRRYQRLHAFQRLLEVEFLVLLAFMQCGKGLWHAATDSIGAANTISEDLAEIVPINMKYALLYLRGVILQGTGDLNAALQVYQSPLFDYTSAQRSGSSSGLGATSNISKATFVDSDVTRNFCLMATLNMIFIIQAPKHPQNNRILPLIKSLEPVIQHCGNAYIQAHFSLVVSVLSGGILSPKQYLRAAMEAGKKIGSAQTTALALIYMQERLFKGEIGEQALKCAKAAHAQSKRAGEPMWTHVAAGLEAQSLEVNGFEADAKRRKQEAEASFDKLPGGIKKVLANS